MEEREGGGREARGGRGGAQRGGDADIGPSSRAGDVIAWNFPAWIRTSMTGHVAFVMEPPRVYPGRPNTFALRIADSSSVPHDRDTRDRGRFRGFGYGDIYVQVDRARGTPVAYRPNLRQGTGFLRTTISLARPLR